MARYTKKPITIDAVQFLKIDADGPVFRDACMKPPLALWVFEALEKAPHEEGAIVCSVNDGLYINTLEGQLHVSKDDWLIRGVKGELYPCKPDIFEATYGPAED